MHSYDLILWYRRGVSDLLSLQLDGKLLHREATGLFSFSIQPPACQQQSGIQNVISFLTVQTERSLSVLYCLIIILKVDLTLTVNLSNIYILWVVFLGAANLNLQSNHWVQVLNETKNYSLWLQEMSKCTLVQFTQDEQTLKYWTLKQLNHVKLRTSEWSLLHWKQKLPSKNSG